MYIPAELEERNQKTWWDANSGCQVEAKARPRWCREVRDEEDRYEQNTRGIATCERSQGVGLTSARKGSADGSVGSDSACKSGVIVLISEFPEKDLRRKLPDFCCFIFIHCESQTLTTCRWLLPIGFVLIEFLKFMHHTVNNNNNNNK